MKSVLFRYFARTSLLVLMSFIFLGASVTIAATSLITNDRRTRYTATATSLAELCSSFYDGGVFVLPNSFEKSTEAIAGVINCRIIYCDNAGVVIFSSDNTAVPVKGDILTEEIKKRIFDDKLKIQSDMDNNLELMSILISKEGADIGAVLILSDTATEKTLIVSFTRIFIIVSIIVMLIAFGTAYINSQYMARPLREMAACARSFELGDFSARVTGLFARDDEIGELAAAFNNMAQELEKSESLKRAFIGDVSHELKTPMTIIAGYIGGILDGTVSPEKQSETLKIIQDEVLRLSRLVKGMMDITRHQSGQRDIHPEPLDIAELATRILFGMETKINDKRLSVDVLVPEKTMLVLADADSMTQVMTNLLDNAVKFSEPGGTLSLVIRSKSGRGHIAVQNTGPVISAEDLPYIFDRFRKSDKSRSLDASGMGLGLFLVKAALQAHGEEISVKSENGRTEFSFSLPEFK